MTILLSSRKPDGADTMPCDAMRRDAPISQSGSYQDSSSPSSSESESESGFEGVVFLYMFYLARCREKLRGMCSVG